MKSLLLVEQSPLHSAFIVDCIHEQWPKVKVTVCATESNAIGFLQSLGSHRLELVCIAISESEHRFQSVLSWIREHSLQVPIVVLASEADDRGIELAQNLRVNSILRIGADTETFQQQLKLALAYWLEVNLPLKWLPHNHSTLNISEAAARVRARESSQL